MKALGLVVSEKKIFYVFPIVCLWEQMTPQGGAIFDPRGMVGRNFKEDHYTLQHTKYESSGPCGLGEEDFFMFSRGGAHMDPRGTVGSIYNGEYYTLVITKYESSGPYGFREEDFFYVFPIVRLRELLTPPPGWAISDPRGMLRRIYAKLHITMLYTKHRSFGCCGFTEDFFMYFPL